MRFVTAERRQSKARVALIGPSGAGKTYSALKIAAGLGAQKIGVIDSERGSALKYAGEGVEFQHLDLDTFAPATYVKAINIAANAGIDCLIVDGLSAAWNGKDGALEQVDRAAKRSQSANSFTAWRNVTPMHNAMIDALVSFPGHLIVTMRAKTEYILEDVQNAEGKVVKAPRKVGLAPIQRDGLEYEFDVVGDITLEHTWLISKTRCSLFDNAIIERPGEEFGQQLAVWLSSGKPIEELRSNVTSITRRAAPTMLATPTRTNRAFADNPEAEFSELTVEELHAYHAWLQTRLDARLTPQQRGNVEAHVRATEGELQRRLDNEAAQADTALGDADDHEDFVAAE